jgi:hypothetical protein
MNDDRAPGGQLGCSAVALKIRILAAQGPKLVYRAEAYEEEDQFRDRKWVCQHEHESVEHALMCGMAWLNDRPDARGSRARLRPL